MIKDIILGIILFTLFLLLGDAFLTAAFPVPEHIQECIDNDLVTDVCMEYLHGE